MQFDWDFPIEVERGVELLLLSEMTTNELVHQRLTAMESSVAEMHRVIEYTESRCGDTPWHAICWFLPLVETGRRFEGTAPDGRPVYSTVFGSWPDVRLHYRSGEIAGYFSFQPDVSRTKSVAGVADLKPWSTTVDEVLDGLGEPVFRDDQWAGEFALLYELPLSSNSVPEQVRLTFSFDLLQQLGHRDRLTWRRYNCRMPPHVVGPRVAWVRLGPLEYR